MRGGHSPAAAPAHTGGRRGGGAPAPQCVRSPAALSRRHQPGRLLLHVCSPVPWTGTATEGQSVGTCLPGQFTRPLDRHRHRGSECWHLSSGSVHPSPGPAPAQRVRVLAPVFRICSPLPRTGTATEGQECWHLSSGSVHPSPGPAPPQRVRSVGTCLPDLFTRPLDRHRHRGSECWHLSSGSVHPSPGPAPPQRVRVLAPVFRICSPVPWTGTATEGQSVGTCLPDLFTRPLDRHRHRGSECWHLSSGSVHPSPGSAPAQRVRVLAPVFRICSPVPWTGTATEGQSVGTCLPDLFTPRLDRHRHRGSECWHLSSGSVHPSPGPAPPQRVRVLAPVFRICSPLPWIGTGTEGQSVGTCLPDLFTRPLDRHRHRGSECWHLSSGSVHPSPGLAPAQRVECWHLSSGSPSLPLFVE
uniref:cDNA FLJ26728 fis, clone PNC06635 n=1 Tax=Homo sapiens TaxID=9606 RepID=Q6ZP14_HUMAN|nr:unnamed protein product [Homo sapiens]|eukprot:NP_001277259.1 uncharacterized protein LOC100129697 [Homo sapiens]